MPKKRKKMPYIEQERRDKFEKVINELLSANINDLSSGDINYIISSLIWKLFENNRSYSAINQIVGIIECVKLEFYRRLAAPYEDEKIVKNGDING